jgi:hypothetical protein
LSVLGFFDFSIHDSSDLLVPINICSPLGVHIVFGPHLLPTISVYVFF